MMLSRIGFLTSLCFIFAVRAAHITGASDQSLRRTATERSGIYTSATITSYNEPSLFPEQKGSINDQEFKIRAAQKAPWICGYGIDNHEPFGCLQDEICANFTTPGGRGYKGSSFFECCNPNGPDIHLLDCTTWGFVGTVCKNYALTTSTMTNGASTSTLTYADSQCSKEAPKCGIFSVKGPLGYEGYVCGTAEFTTTLEARQDVTKIGTLPPGSTVTYTARPADTTAKISITTIGIGTMATSPPSTTSDGNILHSEALSLAYWFRLMIVAGTIYTIL